MRTQKTVISRDSNYIMLIVFLIIIILSLSVAGFLYLQNVIRNLPTLINDTGKIRGGTQRIVKLMLMGRDVSGAIIETEEILTLVHEHVEEKSSIFSQEDIENLSRLTAIWEEVKSYPGDTGETEFYELSERLWNQASLVVHTIESKALRYLIMQYLFSFLVLFSILILILVIFLFKRIIQGRLEKKAAHDNLTGLLNRNYIRPLFHQKTREIKTSNDHLAVLLCDIDHFKSINDTLGHDIGDVVLKGVSQILAAHIRASDNLFRYGGEEFLILTTFRDVANLMQYADRIRSGVEKARINGTQVTISIGVSFLNQNEDLEQLILFADSALYKAKQGGRNLAELYNINLMSPAEKNPPFPGTNGGEV